MDGLIARLLALTGGLSAAAGTSVQALSDLRRLIAAIMIQADPGLASPPLQNDVDPDIAAAIAEAPALADTRTAAGLVSRVLREPYLATLSSPERTAAVFGPFVDASDQLVAFRIVDETAFQAVEMHVQLPFVDAKETPFLLPLGTTGDAALRNFVLPAGTVWIRGERLAQGAPGYAVLRVSGGTLALSAPATQVGPNAPLQIHLDTSWTLTVTPQPAPVATPEGSDGNALAITLPTQLTLQSDGSTIIDGAPGLAGFGSEVRFDSPDGGPVVTDAAIAFPYAGLADPWAIDGGRSRIAAFTGEGRVRLGVWALPLTHVAPDQAFEAAHGGSVAVQFEGALSCDLRGAAGRLLWTNPNLTANALGLELRASDADAAATLDLNLWGPAQTRLDLAGPIRSLRFTSFRDAADCAGLFGGRLRNRWDLPRSASGAPFGFEGALGALTLIAEADGLRRMAVTAVQPPAPEMHGVALQNLYLQVRTARALSFVGSGPDFAHLTEGHAGLKFDVEAGEPMLPDPYAASWAQRAEPRVVEAGLSIAIAWSAGRAPRVQATLGANISFPEPRDDIAESDRRLEARFREHLEAQPEFLGLLDLSSGDHHFGVAMESLSDAQPRLDADNRLTVELRDVRLLMQPQVHWEPVENVTPAGARTRLASESHGGRTLVGANSVKLVPVLPGVVGGEIVAAVGRVPTAALFSLPFGLRAFVAMSARRGRLPRPPAVSVALHAPQFDAGLTSAQQIRMRAPPRPPPFRGLDSARTMPGGLHQTENLQNPVPPLTSVLDDLRPSFNTFSDNKVPLHAVDLSGYGLSTFSDWHDDTKPLPPDPDAPPPPDAVLGVTKVRFDVLNGRTAYEVVQMRKVLGPCQALLVRTVIMERRNSGRVERFDSGWVAQDDGLYSRYVSFETGAVQALRRIRNIRILPQAPLKLSDPAGSIWQAVRFDCDVEIDDLGSGGHGGLTPSLNQLGYVQMSPDTPPDKDRFRALCAAAGGPIGGPVDCGVRLGGTLEMRLSSLGADFAPDDGGGMGFAVAVYGAPTMPRAGQWSTVRIDGATSDVSTVDARHGLPVVRRPGQSYTFREPSDARKAATAKAEFGFLFGTPSSRVLFPKPSIDPGQPGQLTGAPPLMADPISLLKASSAFPRAAFALRGKGLPRFTISAANDWRLDTPVIPFDKPLADVAGAADWTLGREFGVDPDFQLKIDSVDLARPWEIVQAPHDLKLVIPPFGELLTLKSLFAAAADRATAGMQQPTVVFGPVLDAVQDLVNALQGFVDLPFEVNVDVAAGTGPSPSFIVRLNIKLRIGEGPDKRIDIGIGKFYGEFELDGELEAALSGDSRGRVTLTFRGDIQQGILPPLLYAGGLFHFMIEVRDDAEPIIELGLGTTVSIGGDLIKGLVEVEVTVSYGYTLIPETLQPGVLLGLQARAKLLAGLIGFSFGADAMARIQRLNDDDKTVRIFADIRVAASIQVAIFFKKRVDFRTQFEQNLPLAPLLIVAGANPIGAVAASALI